MENLLDYQVYICDQCHFLYNEAKGDPDCEIAPGTRLENIPEGWRCPNCGADKSMLRACQDVDGFA